MQNVSQRNAKSHNTADTKHSLPHSPNTHTHSIYIINMSSSRYYSKRDSRDVSPLVVEERSHSNKSHSSSLRMERSEKQFHLTMHKALLDWKAELQEKHEREMDYCARKTSTRIIQTENHHDGNHGGRQGTSHARIETKGSNGN